MVLIYRPVEQLHKLAIQAGIPYYLVQQLEFGLNLIRSTWDVEKGLIDRNSKLDREKNWYNFKSHFKDSKTELKDIRGPAM